MKATKAYYGTMLDPARAINVFKEQKARMTAQRLAVFDILHNNYSHPSAEEIIEKVKKKLGHVSIATIYNTLDTLEERGLIVKLDGLETKSHYDPDTREHAHCICTKCKTIFDVEIKECTKEQIIPSNFVVTNIILHGICENCK